MSDCYLLLNASTNESFDAQYNFADVSISRITTGMGTGASGYLGFYSTPPNGTTNPTAGTQVYGDPDCVTALCTGSSFISYGPCCRSLTGIDKEITTSVRVDIPSWFSSSATSIGSPNSLVGTSSGGGSQTYLLGQYATFLKLSQTFSAGTSVTVGFGLQAGSSWSAVTTVRPTINIYKITSSKVATTLYSGFITASNYKTAPVYTTGNALSVYGTFTLSAGATISTTDILLIEIGMSTTSATSAYLLDGGTTAITADSTTITGGSCASFIKFALTDAAPTVTSNPSNQSTTDGSSATFSSYGYGIPNATVQWQVSTNSGGSWSNVSGATSNIYTFTTSVAQNSYQYRAVFTNSAGSANSTAATLTVLVAPPVITGNPSNSTVTAGSAASFTASATGSTSVQWQFSTNSGGSWSNVSGAISTTYSFTTSSGNNGYQYRAAFTNSGGTTNTTAATLTVNYAPTVTVNPSNSSVTAGATASFTAAASANPAATVQWQVSTNSGGSWSNVSGATSTTYSFTTSSGNNGYQYRAVFTNAISSATTSAATLTVNVAPVVTLNPTSSTVLSGATATFTASASGTPTPTVQWQVSTNSGGSWSNVSGATSTTYSFTTSSGNNGYQYRAVFTNTAGTATTSAATLTVTVDCYLYIDINGNANTATSIMRVQAAPAVNTAGGYLGTYSTTPATFPSAANPVPLGYSPFTSGSTAYGGRIRRIKGINERIKTTSPEAYSWFDSSYASYISSGSGTGQCNAAGGTALIGQYCVIFKLNQTFSAGTSVTLGFGINRSGSWGTGGVATSVRMLASIWKLTSAGVKTQLYNGYINSTDYKSISDLYVTSVLGTFTLTGSATLTAGTDILVLELGMQVNGGSGSAVIGLTSGGAYGTGGGSTITTDNAVIGTTSTYFNANSFIKFSLPPSTPTVTTQPSNQSTTEGSSVTFDSYGYGIPNATVQWQVSTNSGGSWSNVSGATSNIYTFTTSLAQNSYQYRAVFTNSAGSANSTAATLTVLPAPPVITGNPSNSTVTAGSTATFTASATGSTSVQWQISTDSGASFSNISGATSTTYSFTTSSGNNGYQYLAAFTNSGGTTNTTAATLTVNYAPTVTVNPSNSSVTAGATASFTAAASANPAATVQWQVSTNSGGSWSNVSGATSTTYSFTTSSGNNGYQYRAVFTNAISSATTSAATLTVNVAPVITGNPSSSTVISGNTATFTASASGTPTPTVQWQVSTNSGGSWSDVSGATSTTYSFTTSSGNNGYQYRAVFTNTAGTATTSAATLTTSVTYSESMSGGAKLGGSATISIPRTFIPSGGVLLGGSGIQNFNDIFETSGGSLIGSSATPTVVYAITPSGGARLGSSATSTVVYAITPSGGSLIGSSATATVVYAIVPSGGNKAGGSATATVVYAIVPSGGSRLGSSANQTFSDVVEVSGGSLIGSSATATVVYAIAPSGGSRLGSSANQTFNDAVEVSGGSLIGGSATPTVVYAIAPSGGSRLGSSANQTFNDVVEVSGGSLIGGSATPTVVYAIAPSGGSRLGSSANQTFNDVVEVSGGSLIGSSATPTVVYAIIPSGGSLVGSSATATVVYAIIPSGGVSCPQLVYKNNLLMHLNAGDSTSYPASGTAWYDLSGNGENGTLTNGPTYDNSTYKSIVFDGTNDYVAVGAIAGDFTAFTVTAWFNATTIANYRNIIDCNNNIYTSGNVGPRLEINAAGNLMWIIGGNTSNDAIYNTYTVISSGMSSNTWYSATIVRSSAGLISTYLNGSSIQTNVSNSNGFINAFNNVNLGVGYKNASDRFWIGKIADVQIYNRELSAAEVLRNYNTFSSTNFLNVTPAQTIFNITASGGLRVGGSSNQTFNDIVETSGGNKSGGSSANTVFYAIASSGGSLVGGSANQTFTDIVETSGGDKAGGSATANVVYVIAPSGGDKAGGSATANVVYAIMPSGGTTLAGSATATAIYAIMPSGGTTLGGSATATVVYTIVPSGGIKLDSYTSNDPYYNNVSAMFHFNGINNQTTFSDSSIYPVVLSRHGSPKLNTSTVKFGSSSVEFKSNAGSAVLFPTNSRFDVGSENWTVEFWYYYQGHHDDSARLFQTRDGDLFSGISLSFKSTSPDNTLVLAFSLDGSSWAYNTGDSSGITVTINDWTHVAIVRNGSDLSIYINGIKNTLWSNFSGSLYYNSGDTCVIGGQSVGTKRTVDGHVDEFKFTKGIAVYTSNFSVPTVETTYIPINVNVVYEILSLGGTLVGGTSDQTFNDIIETSGGSLIGGSGTNTVVYETSISGGTFVGGTSDQTFNDIIETSGGMLIAGSLDIDANYAIDVSGGILIAGDSSVDANYAIDVSGGVLIAGSLDIDANYAIDVSGGILIAGDSSVDANYAIDVSGGVLIAGSLDIDANYAIDVSGGVLIAGSLDIDANYAIDVSGGVLIAGSLDIDANYAIDVSGGLILSGIIDQTFSDIIEVSGGSLIGGNAFYYKEYFVEPTNGIILSGIATISYFQNNNAFNEYPEGGISINGSSKVFSKFETSIVGGTSIQGSSITYLTNNLILNGGILVGGSLNQTTNFNIQISGGVSISGYSNFNFIYFPISSGGILFSGSSTTGFSQYILISGGCSLSGISTISSVINIGVSGGVKCSGNSDLKTICFENMLGGILLAGKSLQNIIFKVFPSNGVLISGISLQNIIFKVIPSDGILIGGIANKDFNDIVEVSGGILASGTSLKNTIYYFVFTNGITVGGNSSKNVIFRITPTSGVMIQGTSTINFINRINVFGGVKLSGSANQNFYGSIEVSGGIKLGGKVNSNNTYNEIVNGGITLNSISNLNVVYRITGASGILANGTSNLNTNYNINTTKGVVLGGTSSIAFNDIIEVSGGVRTGGVSLIKSNYFLISTNGIFVGGSSLINQIFKIIPTNGVVVQGNSTITFNDIVNVFGGILVGGNGYYSFNDTVNVSGGLKLGGNAKISLINTFVPSSGIIVSGDILKNVIFKIIPKNGIKVQGNSLINTNNNIQVFGGILTSGRGNYYSNYNSTIIGGIVISGTSKINILYTAATSSGVVVNSNSGSNTYYNILSISKLLVGGSGLSEFNDIVEVFGGISIGGNSNIKIDYNLIASSGISVNGNSEFNQSFYIFPDSGIVIEGNSIYSSVIIVNAFGGVIFESTTSITSNQGIQIFGGLVFDSKTEVYLSFNIFPVNGIQVNCFSDSNTIFKIISESGVLIDPAGLISFISKYLYRIGDILYFKKSALIGKLEKIVINKIRDPLIFDPTLQILATDLDFLPLYVDTFNAYFNQEDLISKEEALLLIDEYNNTPKPQYPIIPVVPDPPCNHLYQVGDVLYFNSSARKGKLESITIKELINPKILNKNSCDYSPLYKDIFNALFKEGDLISKSDALFLINEYNNTPKPEHAIIPVVPDPPCNHLYQVGNVLYFNSSARRGKLEAITIKQLINPKILNKNSCDYSPLYKDTFNAFYKESDLISKSNALFLINEYNNTPKPEHAIIPVVPEIPCNHLYQVGDVLYFNSSARKGKLESISIKQLINPKILNKNSCDYSPLYKDTMNALYKESDLISKSNALFLIEEYNNTPKPEHAIIPVVPEIPCNHLYQVGNVLYFNSSARRGKLEAITIKELINPKILNKNSCDYSPLYKDTMNALYKESDLISKSNALFLIDEYNNTPKPEHEIIPVVPEIPCNHLYQVGNVLYFKLSAKKGRLEAITIKQLINPRISNKNSCDYSPLYKDTMNALFKEEELISKLDALILIENYNI